MGLRSVIDHFKIFDCKVKNAVGRAKQLQFWRTRRRARQLLLDEFGMIEIEVHIPPLPDQLASADIRKSAQASASARRPKTR